MNKMAKSLSVLSLSVGILTSPISSKAQGIVGDWLYNPTTQHEYALTIPGSWNAVRDIATANGGYLASINNFAENQWLVNNFSPSMNFAIGLSDVVQEGNFRWESGEPLAFQNWGPGEPNNIGGENNVYMFSTSNPNGKVPGVWNDYDGIPTIPGVVERTLINGSSIPEPSTMLLLGSGALALLAYHRKKRN